MLCEPPLLLYSDFKKHFVIKTHESEHSVCTVLSQRDDGVKLHSVQIVCHPMNDSEVKYTISEKQELAVLFALKKSSVLLLSLKNLELVTYHEVLKTAFQMKDFHSRLK